MHRSKKVIIFSHCILNQNTVVNPLARAKGAYTSIVKKILDLDIGIHQLPCPEYLFLGLDRKPMGKEEYDSYEYRKVCRKIACMSIKIIKEYINKGYEIVGMVGINCSPTCSIRGERGILMEELFKLLYEEKIDLRSFEIPANYIEEGEKQDILRAFDDFLNNMTRQSKFIFP
ncbi:CD3072 family TudS-related putative desulfidase [Marinisporobacter balticus]|uniref:Putative secreted protein n=1 Tax=Marinisporobacter balticus TaxID=2018667 RepID=A0A4V2S9T5_9FIRM|nr:CD3072 family TudS-related putative desulfidase [Marinisporobacter balticus]TCO69070.1 putative secreted protein [Marinisporobacter balticus]